MRWLLLAALLPLPGTAAWAGEVVPWTMTAQACGTPGWGHHGLLLEVDRSGATAQAALRGTARCAGYAHAVNYSDIPLARQEDGTWLFASPPWRLHLTAEGGLLAFDDWNDVLASPVYFRPS